MNAITIIALCVVFLFSTYVLTVRIIAKRSLWSISDTFYELEDVKKDLGYLFTIWCWMVGITVMALLLELSNGTWYHCLSAVLAGSGLCMVGTAPKFETDDKKKHYSAAALSAVGAIMYVAIAGVWASFICVVIALGMACYTRHWLFWAETGIFSTIFAAILILANSLALVNVLQNFLILSGIALFVIAYAHAGYWNDKRNLPENPCQSQLNELRKAKRTRDGVTYTMFAFMVTSMVLIYIL